MPADQRTLQHCEIRVALALGFKHLYLGSRLENRKELLPNLRENLRRIEQGYGDIEFCFLEGIQDLLHALANSGGDSAPRQGFDGPHIDKPR